MRKPVNPIWKEMQSKYGISDTCFRRYRKEAGDNVEEVIRLCEKYKESKTRAKDRKEAPPKKRQSNIKTTNIYPSSGRYEIATPDHIMGPDEYYVWLHAHLTKSVFIVKKKFFTVQNQSYMDNEDLANDVLQKCLRKTKNGTNAYDDYLKDPTRAVQTIRAFCNRVVTNHCADFCKSIKYTAPTSSLDAQIPGTEELTLGDSIGIMDKDSLSINELIEKSGEVVLKGVPLSNIIQSLIDGLSFTGACKKFKLNSNKVKKALLEMGAVDILGGQLQPETIDKIIAN
jgi:hypothetical protein